MDKQKTGSATKRMFTWGVKTTDISFMRMSEADAAMDGSSSSGSDCGNITKFDKPKKQRPPKTVDRK